MVATDKLFAGSIPEVYERCRFPSSSNRMRATWRSGWPRSNRRMYWKRQREPASLYERSHRAFLLTRAL
jgi:hypothetical protein